MTLLSPCGPKREPAAFVIPSAAGLSPNISVQLFFLIILLDYSSILFSIIYIVTLLVYAAAVFLSPVQLPSEAQPICCSTGVFTANLES